MTARTAVTLGSSSTTRLVQLLGMLGSAYPGERDAAELKANELVRDTGLTWADVIRAPDRDRHDHGDCGGRDHWRDMQAYCLRHRGRLNEREYSFVTDLDNWRDELTERQFKWLLSIFRRVQREEAACRY